MISVRAHSGGQTRQTCEPCKYQQAAENGDEHGVIQLLVQQSANQTARRTHDPEAP